MVTPDDAVSLDLAVDGDGRYLFPVRTSGTSSPLWSLTVVEVAGGIDAPMLVDPQLLGALYLGTGRVELDPYTGLSKNVSRIRAEAEVRFVVREIAGCFVLAS